MKRPELIFNIFLVPVDFLMFFAAGLAAYFLRLSPWLKEWREVQFLVSLPLSYYLILLGILSIVWLIIFAISGLYYLKIHQKFSEEFLKIIVGISAGMIVAIIIYPFLKGEWFYSRFIILGTWLFTIIFVILGRQVMRVIWKKILKYQEITRQRILLIGNGKVSRSILKEEDSKNSTYRIVKHLPILDLKEIKKGGNYPKIDEVVLSNLNYPQEKIYQLIDFCDENRIKFKFAPDLFQTILTNIEIDILGGYPIIEVKRTPLEDWGKVIKRLIDIFGALAGLVLLFPLGIILGAAIKIDSPGPVLVKLKRISRGREFYLYKFRSMVKDAKVLKPKLLNFNERKDGPLFKMKNDPRVTRVGRFIRKARLDELPQLINVILGEISLVGPRPHEPQEVALYEKHHRRSLYIKPGMTGLAQAAGSSDLKFEEEIKLDTYYIENWSLGMDVKIILKTILKLLKDRSAC